MSDESIHFESAMTDHESLMWQLESDPWFDPSGGALMVCDTTIDPDQFVQRIRWAIQNAPRLRERVVTPTVPLSNPRWETDPEFELDFHVRRIALPKPGSERDLLETAIHLYLEPFDRTRPLWKAVMIEGLEGGQGALFVKLHHTIADGIGALKMAELYMQASPADPLPPEVTFSDPEPSTGPSDQAAVANLLRRVAGEISMWGADPRRAVDLGTGLVNGVSDSIKNVFASGDKPGSPLLANRSRHRRFDTVSFDLAEAKVAAKAMGGTLNDFFVTAVAEGALRYHDALGAKTDVLNMSFIVSTRTEDGPSSNSFVPARLVVDGASMSIAKRFETLSAETTRLKGQMRHSSASELIGAVGSILPLAALSKVARQQTASIDIATSNLRSADFPVYISGARLEASYPLGPVAGTGANVTAMSYDGTMYVGIMSDPEAITEPETFARSVEAAIETLIGAGRPPRKKPAKKKATKKKAAARKKPAKKRATKKRATKKKAAARKKPA